MGRKSRPRLKYLGRKLKQIRKHHQLTQPEMYKILKPKGNENNHSIISEYERKVREPSLSEIQSYVSFSGISAEVLIDDEITSIDFTDTSPESSGSDVLTNLNCNNPNHKVVRSQMSVESNSNGVGGVAQTTMVQNNDIPESSENAEKLSATDNQLNGTEKSASSAEKTTDYTIFNDPNSRVAHRALGLRSIMKNEELAVDESDPKKCNKAIEKVTDQITEREVIEGAFIFITDEKLAARIDDAHLELLRSIKYHNRHFLIKKNLLEIMMSVALEDYEKNKEASAIYFCIHKRFNDE